MIRINLLPHREKRRQERKKAFVALLLLSATVGALIVLIVAGMFATKISNQSQRNSFIKSENAKLDAKIKDVLTLQQEIEALKARQQAVEDLQGDRNQPVYLLDELVKQVPEGIYLRGIKQDGQRVVLNGYAHSQERVAELVRNLSSHSQWLERPDLIEIKSTGLGQGRDAKKVFDFTVNVGIKRAREQEQSGPEPAGARASAGIASKKY